MQAISLYPYKGFLAVKHSKFENIVGAHLLNNYLRDLSPCKQR